MNTQPLKIYAAGLFVLVLCCRSIFAGEFAVSPMMIELNPSTRSTQEFSFTLFGKSNTDIKLSLFEMNQLESGYMGFTEAALDDIDSIAAWIDLEDENFRLRDGDAVQVNGRIRVPGRAAGTHLIAIMVEEELPEQERGGVSVKIRYAVILNVSIEGRRSRIRSTFEELVVVEREDGLYLQGFFTNESVTEEMLFSEVQLRDENNRLLERVQLKTASAWERHDAGSRVFPRARVSVYGRITEDFVTGNYQVLARNNFGNRSQAVYRDIVELVEPEVQEVDPGQNTTNDPAVNPISLEPEFVAIEIKNTGTSFSSFSISNNTDEEVKVQLPNEHGNYTALGISSYQFYPATLVLRARQSTKVILQQAHVEGVDYGNIIFTANVETSGEQASTSTLVIPTILVPQD